MSIEITCKKLAKPGCVSVSFKKEDSDGQSLADALRGVSVTSQYDNSSKLFNADIPLKQLSDILDQNSNIVTEPAREVLLTQAKQHFTSTFPR